jgi:hypothetical protein
VRAEQQSLENIAKPLTAEEAEAEAPAQPAGESDTDVRIRHRNERRRAQDRRGLRRVRPGPGRGSTFYSPGMVGSAGTAGRYDASSQVALDSEIAALVQTLLEYGPTRRQQLRRLAGADLWGPGRFGPALRQAVDEGRATRVRRGTYAPPGDEIEARQAPRGPQTQPPRGRPA